MSDDEIGYRQPPRHTRFKPGVSGNPKGRPKRSEQSAARVVNETLNAEAPYREGGKLKKAPRWQLNVLSWIKRALNGDVEAAAMLLLIRDKSLRRRVTRDPTIEVDGWLPEDFEPNFLLKIAKPTDENRSNKSSGRNVPAQNVIPDPSRR